MWYIGVSGSDVLIYVMAPNSYCYTLMAYSVVFFFVFFLLWLDACFRNLKLHAPVKSITNWVCIAYGGIGNRVCLVRKWQLHGT